jgi:PAS domain S-box-containing protein
MVHAARVAAAMGLYALVGGIVTLVGWLAGIYVLTDWDGDGISMKANAAVVAIAAGTALLLLALRPTAHLTTRALGVLVASIGALTLIEHVAALDFGIDTLIADEPPGARATASPGRMGPPASLASILLGAGLLLATVRGPRRAVARGAAALLGTVAASLGFLSLIGYLFRADSLYTVPRLTGISSQNATVVLAIAVGLVALLPESQPMRTFLADGPMGVLARRALPVVLIVPVALGWARVEGERAGLYDGPMGTAMTVVALIIVLTSVLAWTASAVGLREKALVEGRERLDGILSSINDRYQGVDAEGRFTYFNDAARRLYVSHGLDPDALLGRRVVDDVFPRERSSDWALALNRCLRDRVTVDVESFYEPWQSWYWIRYVPTPGGGAAAVAQDITARKQAEEERRRSASELARQFRLFDTALAALQDFVYVLDAQGRFVYANKALLEFWGASDQGAIGRSMRELGYPADVEAELLRDVTTVMETNLPATSETRYTSPSGVSAIFENFLAPVPGAGADPPLVAGSSRDVTQRRRTEAELREADRRKDQFLATLAHELRNPLAPVRNAVQILKAKGSEDPQARWSRDVIDRQVQHMARLLDDLLDVSRISRDNLRLRRERCELGAIIDSALETSQPLIEAGGQKLEVLLRREPLHLDADPVRLAQVFANLLNNAAKYTPPGGHVTLRAERAGRDVVVSVTDDGIGIGAEMMPRLFEMFSQGVHGPEQTAGGLGIGLSLVKGLVELHGGTVEASSDGPGAGSEFVVRLPLAEAEAAEGPAIEGRDDAVPRRRVLVVDDLADSADSLAMLLRVMGHEAHTAYDGATALRTAAKLLPDVVLLDLGMPNLNGYDTCRALRDQPWGRAIRVVALTGWGQDEDRRRTAEAGFDHHLVKPVEPSALMSVLASLPGSAGSTQTV